jgi:hypothetical protein
MDKRTTSILLIVAAVLLCGCPGLIAAFMGIMFAVVGLIPGANIDIGGSHDPQSAMTTGIGTLCVGIILIAIPIIVAIVVLRRRKQEAATPPPPPPVSNDPLPPTS